MIRVLFLINSLGGGGAERVLVNLANNMDKARYDITVQTIFRAGVNKDNLSTDVRLREGHFLNVKGASAFIRLVPKSILLKMCGIDEDYDVVIAYMHGAPTKVLWEYKKAPKLAWLHCDMEHSSLLKFFSQKQVVSCFGTFDRIVGVSKSVCDSFSKLYGLSDKLVTVYNTNDTQKIKALSEKPVLDLENWRMFSGLKLITVGRLHPQKGYDRLINICERLRIDGENYRLLILGVGSEEDKLKQLVKEKDLKDYVIFGGYHNNPYPYIKAADLFVCSSRYEGLSTVMSETIVLGTPIITTDVSGAQEVLGENSEYGLIVANDEDSLYAGMKQMMHDSEMLIHYRAKAIERAPFFATKRTVRAVEDLIKEVYKCWK